MGTERFWQQALAQSEVALAASALVPLATRLEPLNGEAGVIFEIRTSGACSAATLAGTPSSCTPTTGVDICSTGSGYTSAGGAIVTISSAASAVTSSVIATLPTGISAGTYAVQMQATDGCSSSTTSTQVDVTCNCKPEANANPVKTLWTNTDGGNAFYAVSATDGSVSGNNRMAAGLRPGI